MNKFIDTLQILEINTQLVSPHLRWVLRNVAAEHSGLKNLNVIAYHENLPEDNWGEAAPIFGGIAINLQRNFDHIIDAVQEDENIFMSIRALLIRELLDTTIHEAFHLKATAEGKVFMNDTDEDVEASALGLKYSWIAAKNWDVDIFMFGGILDDLLEDFIESIKEDCKDKPVMWKELQIYMWDNKLSFYNPEKGQELNMRRTFEARAYDVAPWLEESRKFIGDIAIVKPPIEEQIVEKPITAKEETVISAINTAAHNFATGTQSVREAVASVAVASMAPGIAAVTAPTAYSSDEELSTINYDDTTLLQPSAEMMAVYTAATLPTPSAPPAAPSSLTREEIITTTETVLRSLFWHIFSKCEFNTEGGFNNPNAVLEPVDVTRIPNAAALFTNVNTLNEHGIFTPNYPCNGHIKGLVSKQGLPMYILYLNAAGGLHKRTFIVQNPNKMTGGDNPSLTKWAMEARQGTKIMMLLEDTKGLKAHIKLEPELPLGQEKYELCVPK